MLLFFAACATRPSSTPKVTEPDIVVAQEVGPAEVAYPIGPIDLKYAFRVTNNWTQPMTAIRVDLRTLNPSGGAYSLTPRSYNVRETIPPGESRTFEFWARGYSYGRGPREAEPVSLRAIVHFETPEGTYQSVIMRELPQAF